MLRGHKVGVGQGPVDPREELLDSHGGSSFSLSPIILGSREVWLLTEVRHTVGTAESCVA